MNAKLGNFSEISKLMSVKSKMSGDILSLFSQFGLGHLLCRLSLEKHDGISAVQLILSLCLFRINGETIHSIYKKNFYHLLETGKNCYYRTMVRQAMDWCRLLNYTVLRFESLLRKNGIKTEYEDSCVIFDDTTLEKTGKRIRDASRYTSKKISLKLLFLSDIFFSICPAASHGTCLAVLGNRRLSAAMRSSFFFIICMTGIAYCCRHL